MLHPANLLLSRARLPGAGCLMSARPAWFRIVTRFPQTSSLILICPFETWQSSISFSGCIWSNSRLIFGIKLDGSKVGFPL